MEAPSHIPRGLDLLETVPEGTAQDFADRPIPGLFFGLFAARFKGKIMFQGKPIAREVWGSTDTIVMRKKTAPLPGPSSIPIKMVKLSLKSTEPIKIRRLFWTETWDVHAGLSPLKESEGHMIIRQHREALGGTFDSQLHVYPCLTFSRRGRRKVRKIDLNDPIELNAKNVPWAKSVPPGMNPPPPAAGLSPGFLFGLLVGDPVRRVAEHKARSATHAAKLGSGG